MTFNSTMLRTITEYHIDYGFTHKTLTWSTNTRYWFQVCSERDESLPEASIDDEKDGDKEGWHLAGVDKGVRPEKTKEVSNYCMPQQKNKTNGARTDMSSPFDPSWFKLFTPLRTQAVRYWCKCAGETWIKAHSSPVVTEQCLRNVSSYGILNLPELCWASSETCVCLL